MYGIYVHISICNIVEHNSTILILTPELNHSRVWHGSLITITMVPRKPLTPGMCCTIWLWQGHYCQNSLLTTSLTLLFFIIRMKIYSLTYSKIRYRCEAKFKNKTKQCKLGILSMVEFIYFPQQHGWRNESIICIKTHINILNTNMMVAVCPLCRIVCESLIKIQKHD